jgi:hypothetical protein
MDIFSTSPEASIRTYRGEQQCWSRMLLYGWMLQYGGELEVCWVQHARIPAYKAMQQIAHHVCSAECVCVRLVKCLQKGKSPLLHYVKHALLLMHARHLILHV